VRVEDPGILRGRATFIQAAIFLLLEFWREDALDTGFDWFHWANETEYLTVADLAVITREI
jgi:hypothetical protein